MAKLDAPVVLCIFNRPVPTAKVLQRILEAEPSKLFVIADGPRDSHPGETELCLETRELVANCETKCEVSTLYSEVNMGCKQRIATGLDWVFSQVDRAIILEDDCLPELTFFTFCEQLLAVHQHNAQVHMIGGNNFLSSDEAAGSSYYLSQLFHIWGWATWRRAWRHFDVDMRAWHALSATDWLENSLPTKDMARVARFFFDETDIGNINGWDYQWVLSGWLLGAGAIVPEHNLVTNIGYGPDATHMTNPDDPLASLPTQALQFPLRHPAELKLNHSADLKEFEQLNGSLARRLSPTWRAGFRKIIAKIFRQ